MWSLGANLLAPIFTGGALKTQVEIRTAEQKQAIAEYAVVGLRAFGEVEGALAAEIAAREREEILVQALSDNQQALGVVQARFKVGTTDLRFVEQRQLAVGATQSALIRVQAEQRVQRVNLHLALGGSFEQPPPRQRQRQRPHRRRRPRLQSPLCRRAEWPARRYLSVRDNPARSAVWPMRPEESPRIHALATFKCSVPWRLPGSARSNSR